MKHRLLFSALVLCLAAWACTLIRSKPSESEPLLTPKSIIQMTDSPPTPTTATQPVICTPAPTQPPLPCMPSSSMTAYRMVGQGCDKMQCLFMAEANYPVGMATLVGYYTQTIEYGFGDDKQLCNNFVITGGSQELIRSYLAMIEKGSSINSKNELDQPIISLDFNKLTEAARQAIVASNSNHPIELVVLSQPPLHASVRPCFSSVIIVQVIPMQVK